MSNHLNIPKVLPFKFVPNTTTPGIHFDDDWAYNRIKNFERKVFYAQKWKRAVTTKLQITTTIEPDPLRLYNSAGTIVKSFPWTIAAVGAGGENAWECTFNVSTGVATDGIYYLYQKCELLSVKFEAISEPIHIKNDHRNVREWKFKHSENAFGVIWTTGIEMTFMCESDIMDYEFMHDRNDFIDQVHNVDDLSAFPYREMKMYIGEARGVAEHVIDTANRVMCCDHVLFKDLYIKLRSGSKKFDVNRQKGYPLVGGSVEIVPAFNDSSLQFIDITPMVPGVVMIYNIDTNFFGNGSVVRITEFQMT